MKLPWRKNDQQSAGSLPPEITQYYEASRKERTSVAWLLAFATLAITVVVAFGAFFAGRWVYRKIAGNNEPTPAVNVPNDQTNDGKEPKPPANKPAEPKKKAPKPKKQHSVVNTPTTGPSTGLADTGPGGTLAVFITSAVIGTTFYEFRLRRKTN